MKIGIPGTGRRLERRVHRLVLEAFVGVEPSLFGRHLDGDRSNNALSNLAYGTPRQNSQDMVEHGRSWGSRTHCRKGLHEWTEENTRWIEVGGRPRRRQCRACYREWKLNYRRAQHP